MPKVDNKKTEDLSPDQLTTLLEAIDQSEHTIAAAMMKMALYTGIRRGEMFKLTWDDIDVDRGFIFIREPKGGVSQKIPINSAAKLIFSALPRTSKYVFPGRGGRQRTTVTREVNSIKLAAGLPKNFRPLHGLRHAYASMLASSGQVDMYTLQKLLTHKSPQMTQRYAHLRDDALQNAADLAGHIISQTVKKKEIKESAKEYGTDPQDINQYDLSKKLMKKRRTRVGKSEKKTIAGMKQLEIAGLKIKNNEKDNIEEKEKDAKSQMKQLKMF